MYCSVCGTQNVDGDKFCAGCGTPFPQQAAPQAAPQQPAPQQAPQAAPVQQQAAPVQQQAAPQQQAPVNDPYAAAKMTQKSNPNVNSVPNATPAQAAAAPAAGGASGSNWIADHKAIIGIGCAALIVIIAAIVILINLLGYTKIDAKDLLDDFSRVYRKAGKQVAVALKSFDCLVCIFHDISSLLKFPPLSEKRVDS